ncbi:unnamed protein product [marine sediment metagenome]|uniref:Uncharacterized protein n=1 Tax=marine sediment metagenome TaxID=412755 RepID=X0SM21_9ZZZZ
MALDDLTPEALSDRVKLGDRLTAWTTRNGSALNTIDGTFTALDAEIVKFAGDQDMIDYLDGKKDALKLAMFNIYQKY